MIENVSLKQCMDFAVATEDIGAKYYDRLSDKFSDNPEISDLFSQLCKDERIHIQQFSELLNNLPPETDLSNSPEKAQYVRAMSISEFFSHHQGPFQDDKEIENRDDALERAFNFEKATLGFYKAVEESLGPNPTLTKVIETEKGHIVNLMKSMLVEGSKFRSLQDVWT
ncbi:MAG: ferritin-like domain-containing protein [Chloroflexi bacterium]|nr:ferritin-like domain-containing protein [Chloroflexota bacterium]